MPLLLPDGLVFEIGKDGTGYLLNGSKLGGVGANPLYSASVCKGSWGGGFYRGGVSYVACSDGMYALSLDTSAKAFAPLSSWSVNANAVAPPIFAGGFVWSTGASATASPSRSTLSALNPSTGATVFSAELNGFQDFTTPSAGGGRLFVANQDPSGPGGDQITALRIANAPPSPPPPPAISHLRVRAVRGKLRVSLNLSEPARLTEVVSKLVPGRVVKGRCRAGARHGRRCQASVRRRTFVHPERAGRDTFGPRMRRLAPGRYAVTVTATDSAGDRSAPRTAVVTVRRG